MLVFRVCFCFVCLFEFLVCVCVCVCLCVFVSKKLLARKGEREERQLCLNMPICISGVCEVMLYAHFLSLYGIDRQILYIAPYTYQYNLYI